MDVSFPKKLVYLSKISKAMKRVISLLLTGIFLMFLWACGDKHSERYNSLEKEIKDLENTIDQTSDCDDLQLLNFSILGLYSDASESDDNALSETEFETISGMLNDVEVKWRSKCEQLGCLQADSLSGELDTLEEEYEDYDIL